MVTQVTSLSRSGLSDWLIQRVSSLLLAAYTLCILGFVLLNPGLGYGPWQAFMAHPGMQVFTLVSLLAACAHAWVGLWTLGTDYLREAAFGRAATGLRLAYQLACILALLGYLVWGLLILWGGR